MEQSGAGPTDKISGLDRTHRLVTVAAATFLLIIFGTVIGVLFSQPLTVHVNGLVAVLNADEEYRWWWRESRFPESGLTRFQSGKAWDGITFYVSTAVQTARMLDMNGNVLHEWHYPLSRLEADAPGQYDAPIHKMAAWDTAYPFPNGDLLAVTSIQGIPSGLIKLDRNSELIWYNPLGHHHTVSVGPDQKIYTLTRGVRNRAVEMIEPPIVEDFITILSPEGAELRSFSVIDAFARSPFAQHLHLGRELDNGDSFHANEADLVPPGLTRKALFLKPGYIIISLREIHTIAVVDPKREIVVWAAKGPWFYQHDPEILANGNILLFDNRGDQTGWGESRALEINPLTHAIEWQYGGTEDRPLYSFIRSGVQRLGNGNTLVIESDTGRMLEVMADGTIVWEYIVPDRLADDVERVSAIGLDAFRSSYAAYPFLNDTGALAD